MCDRLANRRSATWKRRHMMGKRLEGKAVVVTGAGSVGGQTPLGELGNGRAAAIAYAAEGARVVAVDLSRESAEATRALVEALSRLRSTATTRAPSAA